MCQNAFVVLGGGQLTDFRLHIGRLIHQRLVQRKVVGRGLNLEEQDGRRRRVRGSRRGVFCNHSLGLGEAFGVVCQRGYEVGRVEDGGEGVDVEPEFGWLLQGSVWV